MFEDALMESAGRIHTRAGWFSGMAALINGSVACVLVLWPLLYPASLPRRTLSMLLTVPAPPAPPTPTAPHPASLVRVAAAANPFAAPQRIPHAIAMKSEAAPALDPSFNPLAVSGAVGANGIPAGLGASPAPAVRVVSTPPSKLVLSSGVVAGNKLSGADPVYPAIARAVRVQGVVVLAAIIAKDGTIENLHVVSGPGLLTAAALDAVRGWRYRPYLLNGRPVEVETTVRVVFTLGG
jgi:periplasmic protein TonB